MHFDAAREIEIEERACSAATSAFRFHRPKFGAFIAACLGRAAYERVRREQITAIIRANPPSPIALGVALTTPNAAIRKEPTL